MILSSAVHNIEPSTNSPKPWLFSSSASFRGRVAFILMTISIGEPSETSKDLSRGAAKREASAGTMPTPGMVSISISGWFCRITLSRWLKVEKVLTSPDAGKAGAACSGDVRHRLGILAPYPLKLLFIFDHGKFQDLGQAVWPGQLCCHFARHKDLFAALQAAVAFSVKSCGSPGPRLMPISICQSP